MEKIIENSSSTRETFFGLVEKTLKHQNLSNSFAIEWYLVEILEKFRDQTKLIFQPQLQSLIESFFKSKSPAEKFSRIRDIGDSSLMLSSVFSKWVTRNRALVGLPHFIKVAKTAYSCLVPMIGDGTPILEVFNVFSRNIEPYVRVLNYIGQELEFEIGEDDYIHMLNLYNATGDENIRKWLIDHGVVMLPEFDETEGKIII